MRRRRGGDVNTGTCARRARLRLSSILPCFECVSVFKLHNDSAETRSEAQGCQPAHTFFKTLEA